jgi:hypothetical protein
VPLFRNRHTVSPCFQTSDARSVARVEAKAREEAFERNLAQAVRRAWAVLPAGVSVTAHELQASSVLRRDRDSKD